MKQLIAVAVAFLCLGLGVRAEDASSPTEMEKPALWHLTIAPAHVFYQLTHDALEVRQDFSQSEEEQWRDGRSSGRGWGILARVSREGIPGDADLSFIRSTYEYTLDLTNGSHRLTTERRDVGGLWRKETGRSDDAEWGWLLGFRYSGQRKKGTIKETGLRYATNVVNNVTVVGSVTNSTSVTNITSAMHTDIFSGTDSITWTMVSSGYYGELRPFKSELLTLHGSLEFLFGEVSGPARVGNDTAWDGKIQETYDRRYSLAYGAILCMGAKLAMTDRFAIRIDYTREWMYSFAATDTGIVMFPDNNDALFSDMYHAVTLAVEIDL